MSPFGFGKKRDAPQFIKVTSSAILRARPGQVAVLEGDFGNPTKGAYVQFADLPRIAANSDNCQWKRNRIECVVPLELPDETTLIISNGRQATLRMLVLAREPFVLVDKTLAPHFAEPAPPQPLPDRPPGDNTLDIPHESNRIAHPERSSEMPPGTPTAEGQVSPQEHSEGLQMAHSRFDLPEETSIVPQASERISHLIDEPDTFDPDVERAMYGVALRLTAVARYDSALSMFTRLCELNPKKEDYPRGKAGVLHLAGDFEKALDVCKQAATSHPPDPLTLTLKANALLCLGRTTEALATSEQAIALRDACCPAWNTKGAALSQMGYSEKAADAFKRACRIDPKCTMSWYNSSLLLAEIGNYDQALAAIGKALQSGSDNPKVWNMRGLLLKALGKQKESIEAFDHALAIQPDYYLALKNKAYSLRRYGLIREALAAYDQAIALRPFSTLTWINKGNVLVDLGHHFAALEAYSQATDTSPSCHFALREKARTLLRMLQFREAIKIFNKSEKLSPSDWTVPYLRTIALFSLDRHRQAVQSLKRAITINPRCKQAVFSDNEFDAIRAHADFQQLLFN